MSSRRWGVPTQSSVLGSEAAMIMFMMMFYKQTHTHTHTSPYFIRREHFRRFIRRLHEAGSFAFGSVAVLDKFYWGGGAGGGHALSRWHSATQTTELKHLTTLI